MGGVGETVRSRSEDYAEGEVGRKKVAKGMMGQLKGEIGCVTKRRGMEHAATREGIEL